MRHFTHIATFSCDLHVLGTPPAFILSQNQTLRYFLYIRMSFFPSAPRRKVLIGHSLQIRENSQCDWDLLATNCFRPSKSVLRTDLISLEIDKGHFCHSCAMLFSTALKLVAFKSVRIWSKPHCLASNFYPWPTLSHSGFNTKETNFFKLWIGGLGVPFAIDQLSKS